MEMSDIRSLEIVAGPGPVAYSFDTEEGTLTVWVHENSKEAPASAQKGVILEGFSTWTMGESAGGDQ
jgi:hypothetical protein